MLLALISLAKRTDPYEDHGNIGSSRGRDSGGNERLVGVVDVLARAACKRHVETEILRSEQRGVAVDECVRSVVGREQVLRAVRVVSNER